MRARRFEAWFSLAWGLLLFLELNDIMRMRVRGLFITLVII
jgi:hypothetical protein